MKPKPPKLGLYNKKERKKELRHLRFFIVVYLFWCLSLPFSSINNMLQDYLCRDISKAQDTIFVIGIDRKSLQAYGPWNSWPRTRMAELLEMLNKDSDNRPAAIGIDISYMGETENDQTLLEASRKYDNLVFASELDISSEIQLTDENIYAKKMSINGMDIPICSASRHGFTNILLDNDGVVRRNLLTVTYEGVQYYNFAYEVYRTYMEAIGETPVLPPVNKAGLHHIAYSAVPGSYGQGLSFYDVMEGNIPLSLFKDSVVLVGAYTSGMMDSYYTPIDRGTPMYGVEINANMVQAYCEQKTMYEVPFLLQLASLSIILYICGILYRGQTWVKNCVLFSTTAGFFLLIAVLARIGYLLDPLYLALSTVILYIYWIITDYMKGNKERLRTMDAFKRYVSPEVARLLLEQSDTSITGAAGNKRHIAVLFVDIRGFTPLSEKLPPEAVAGILNEYLTLTSSVIFENGGTVDKFIGDATMALFNAPVNLEDYVFRSVKTALEIIKGSHQLNKQIQEKYGITAHFGIGIHCGEAVVGSIGAPFRMDYTAIGDTVNIAARLESIAAPDQILISHQVLEAISNRLDTISLGARQLKGKSVPLELYQVNALR